MIAKGRGKRAKAANQADTPYNPSLSNSSVPFKRFRTRRMEDEGELQLTAEVAEEMRQRQLKWVHIPPRFRKLVLPFLTVQETLRLDTAVAPGRKKEREHLEKAYVGLRLRAFDEYVFSDKNDFAGVKWVRKRGIEIRHMKLVYKGVTDEHEVLAHLVKDKNEDMATYYAERSDAKDIRGITLAWASERGYLIVLQCILRRSYADVNVTDENGGTPLYHASKGGHLEVVRVLIAAGAFLNKHSKQGQTAIFWASKNGHAEVVRSLVAAGAKVNKANKEKQCPLYWACREGHVEVVRVLLAAKANMSMTDKYGETPLYIAASEGHLDVVKALLAAKTGANKANDHNVTPLCIASLNGHFEVAKALIHSKGDVL